VAVSRATAVELSAEDLLVAVLLVHTREILVVAAVECVREGKGADLIVEKSVRNCSAWLLLS